MEKNPLHWSLPRLRPAVAYPFAVILTVATVVVQHQLAFVTTHAPFLILFLTAFVSALVGGQGPAAVAVVLGAALANYHFLPPPDQFTTSTEGIVATGFYLLVALVVCALTVRLHDAHRDQQALAERLRLAHEGERVARTKAEEEACLRERLMAILGHDLQQPLSVISASASILPLVGDVAVCRGVLESISRNAARMNRMIQEILDFTRVRTLGTLPVDPKPTSLSDACGRAVDDARMAFPGWKIELRSEDVRGEWDPERLQQVLSNLIGNACHYGNPARPVLVCARREPDAAVLEVHNEGAPIPPDLQPVIFEAFRRSPGASRRSGLGLGLYIVSEIVRAHRGSIEVRSSDQGTTFLVRLPTPGAPGPTLNGMGVAAADVDLRSVDTVRPARGGDGRRQPDGAGADRGEAHFGELFALAPDRAPER